MSIDNKSQVSDLFVDRTQDCSQSGRTIWCSSLVQNKYSRNKYGCTLICTYQAQECLTTGLGTN